MLDRFSSVPAMRSNLTLFAGALVCLAALFSAPDTSLAQSAILTSAEIRGSFPADRREELYEKLKKQTTWMQHQSAVLKTVVELAGPSVVHIEADLSDAAKGPIEESGSGVLIKRKGRYYVLTNRHVIRNAKPQDISIKLHDRRWLRPKRIIEDVQTDIAVLEIEAPNLAEAKLGDSALMQTGDFVLAMGSPFGLSRSVTFGIISAVNRRNLQLGDSSVKFQDFLQTDAAIHPGNSGGPLINLDGEIIGINTAIASSTGQNEGVGFAIPINMAMNVARQLIDNGEVSRAFLGVNIDSNFGPAMAAEVGLPRPIGARITSVTPGAPADVANLRINDVILKFQNTPVDDCAHLINMIGVSDINVPVELVVFRDREQMIVEVKLDDARKYRP